MSNENRARPRTAWSSTRVATTSRTASTGLALAGRIPWNAGMVDVSDGRATTVEYPVLKSTASTAYGNCSMATAQTKTA